jgi:hypothetical protein
MMQWHNEDGGDNDDEADDRDDDGTLGNYILEFAPVFLHLFSFHFNRPVSARVQIFACHTVWMYVSVYVCVLFICLGFFAYVLV